MEPTAMKGHNEVIIYRSPDGLSDISVRFEGETAWLTQQQMAELFQTSRTNIVEHIKHIYEEGELTEEATCRNFRQVRTEGKREVSRELTYYNLDMIISVGYRVKSVVATRFRQWATLRLREYIVKGFTIDDERMKSLGGGGYWRELLDRIREIRSSEKVMYRQVLDLYATAMDYDPRSDYARRFFQTVQNKLHYAAHGHTASEVVYMRVDSDKPFAGLMSFKGEEPTQAEAMVAKNYLDEQELRVLNNLVAAYFDLAELNAIEERPMRMADYLGELERILSSTGRPVLQGKGSISREAAESKARIEYQKYRNKTLSSVEKEYLKSIATIEQEAKEGARKAKERNGNKPSKN